MSTPYLRTKLAELASSLRHGGREMDAHLIDLALRDMHQTKTKLLRLEQRLSDRRYM